MKLTKSQMTAKDFRGCEFPYTKYTTREFGEVIEVLYQDGIKGFKTTTLAELKEKLSALD